MPRKKENNIKKTEENPKAKQINTFAAVAEEVQESYKSLLLGIAVVFLVGVIVIGYLSNRNAQNTQPIKQATTIKVEKKQDILGIHTVQTGEDLKTISVKYYETPELFMAIAYANSISNPDVIDEGRKLAIPKVDKKQMLASYTAKPVNRLPITQTSYTVAEGDLLWDIAVRAYGDGYKWKQIMQENNLPSADTIFPGMILQISH